jgi:pyruvate/2-oxoglutarate dehydrogenase complex dihydrolipoamide acyltransferase (E2) component
VSITHPNNQAQDLARSRAALMTTLRRALVERRDQVEFGDVAARFQRAGETFEDGSNTMLALETGIYLKLPTFRGGIRVDGQWLFHGASDHLEAIVAPYIERMSVLDLEALRVGISAGAVLRDMVADRAAARAPAPAIEPAPNSGEAPTPPPPARRMRMH